MINAVSSINQVYAANNHNSVKRESSIKEPSSDTVEIYDSKNFLNYMRQLRQNSLVFSGDIDDVLHNVSDNYSKALKEIEDGNYSEDERLEKTAVLNYCFEMTLRSAPNQNIFRNESTEYMNYGYSQFLMSNGVKDYEGVPYESKSKKIIKNHDANMELILGCRKQVDSYVNAFYEEFINGLRANEFSDAFAKATVAAKQKSNEKGISYDELNSFIKDDLFHIGDDYYWYTYDSVTNRTYKHNTTDNVIPYK